MNIDLSFCQFLTEFKLSKEKAFKFLGITKSPRFLSIYDYGDCISIEFKLGDRHVSREIDWRDIKTV